MASTESGRYASVKVGTTLVPLMGAWTLNIAQEEIDTSSFGTVWGSSDVGMAKWSGSFSGHFDGDDTTQASLLGYQVAGTLIGNLRLYCDNTTFWEAQTTTGTGAGGARLTSVEIGADKAGVNSVTFNFSGSGAITQRA